MTEPVSNKVQLSGYTGIQAGLIRNSAKENFLATGVVLGGEVSYKGAFARTQVMGGTTVGAEAQIGYEFDLGKNMGLELSAKTQMYKNMVNDLGSTTLNLNPINYQAEHTINNQEGQAIIINESFENNYTSSWKHGMQQTGLKAQLNFSSGKAQFGVGIEAGTRNSIRPNISHSSNINSTIEIKEGDKTIDVQNIAKVTAVKVDNGVEGYVTPTFTAKVNLGKNFSFNANADLYQGQLGVRYNF